MVIASVSAVRAYEEESVAYRAYLALTGINLANILACEQNPLRSRRGVLETQRTELDAQLEDQSLYDSRGRKVNGRVDFKQIFIDQLRKDGFLTRLDVGA